MITMLINAMVDMWEKFNEMIIPFYRGDDMDIFIDEELLSNMIVSMEERNMEYNE